MTIDLEGIKALHARATSGHPYEGIPPQEARCEVVPEGTLESFGALIAEVERAQVSEALYKKWFMEAVARAEAAEAERDRLRTIVETVAAEHVDWHPGDQQP